jgi:hypothetical protein
MAKPKAQNTATAHRTLDARLRPCWAESALGFVAGMLVILDLQGFALDDRFAHLGRDEGGGPRPTVVRDTINVSVQHD